MWDIVLKLSKLSIKWKLFVYLAAFATVMLLLLWLFQVVFLDNFYKLIKVNDIKSTAKIILRNIDNANLQSLVTRLSLNNDIYIKITDTMGNDIYSADTPNNPSPIALIAQEQYQFYQKALQNGGTYLEHFIRGRDDFKNGQNDQFKGNEFIGRVPPPNMGMTESIVYVKVVTRNDNTDYIVILNSIISPVNATVQTLRVQLICVTAIMLVLSLLLALYISRKISKPIIKINLSAKELAKGNYGAIFTGAGYLEICELSNTLNIAAKELATVEGLRRELIANISHDLRTPLTLISGYSEVMRDIPGENIPENVQVVIDEAKRLTALVNDILDISKLQSCTQELKLSDFNLTQSIKAILKRYTKLMEQDKYDIKFVYDTDVVVHADDVKISQVIYNLINNAITYTGADKSVRVCQSVNGKFVKIEVADTGEGIPAEELPHIWDRYYKVDKTHKRAAIGSGLGLSIVKTILDIHGAKYGVISSEGHGSVFWYELKIVSNKS